MFYAHFVLAKKGPLARIWLAAHWDKKLTKSHVFETNIEKSVDGILQPKVKMALRTSGHLLLGVVRIYSRKAKYLLADCNEAFVKIKMAFRPGMVDLPEDIREAAVSAITFPEVFHDFDTPMPELNDVDIQAQFTLNQSRAEEITMREDYSNIPLVPGDDSFGDMSFEEPPDLIRATSAIDQTLDPPNLMFEESGKEKEQTPHKDDVSSLSVSRTNMSTDLEAPIRDDGFGGNLPFGPSLDGGLFDDGGLFGDTPMDEAPSIDAGHPEKDQVPESNLVPPPIPAEDSDDDGGALDQFGGPPSVGPPSSNEGSLPPPSPRPTPTEEGEDQQKSSAPENAESAATGAQDETTESGEPATLLQNEEESFALAPIDASTIKPGWPRVKRKRKLIVDEVKNISGEEMKAQLSDTSDIVTGLELAPPTKRLMHWKETGGVEKLFALPGRAIHARFLADKYQRHLTSEASSNEDFGMAGDKELENLSLEQVRDADDPDTTIMPKPRGRPPKRKHMDADDEEVIPARVTRSKEQREQRHQIGFDELTGNMPGPETPAPEQPPLEPETPQEEANQSLESIGPPPTPDCPFSVPPAPETPSFNLPSVGPASVGPPSVAPPTPVHQQEEEAPPASVAGEDPNDPSRRDSLGADESIHHGDDHDDGDHMDDDQPMADNSGFDDSTNNPAPPAPTDTEAPPTPSRVEEADEIEEQAEDETYEEYEERVLNKRAAAMFHQIKKKLRTDSIQFTEMVQNNNRKQVVQKFYTMLVLKKLQAVELSQKESFSEILVERGRLFESAKM